MSIEDLKVKPEILSPKPPSIATDEEFTAGTSTTASPTVKQAKEKLVTTDTTQTITASKNLKTGGTVAYSRPFQIFMPTSTESNPTEDKTREIAFLSSDGTGNNYEGSLTHTRSTTGESYTGLRAGRLVNGTYKEGKLGVRITADGTTFGTAPNTPANASGNVIVTADYVQNKYVDLNTNQTITGPKVFTARLLRKSTNIDVTSKATSSTYNPLVRFRDKNNKELGAVNNAQMSGGIIRTLLEARNKDDYVPTIGVQAPYEGSTGGFGYAPNTPDNAPDNAIVTKDKIANMVTTNTAQTISGVKTFKGVVTAELEPINFIAKNPTMDVHVTPSANKYVGYDFRDKNNVRIGYIGISQGTDGKLRYEIQKLNNNVTAILGITPPAVSAGEEIVTAGWFNYKMQVVSALPAAPDANVFYFIPG